MDELTQIELSPLEQFKAEAKASLPGLLAYFDFADTKRRNCHLGHSFVDEEIKEFDRLIRATVGDTGTAKRVGGESWLALLPNGTVEALSELLVGFQLQQTIEIGWQCTGEKDGETKVAQRTVDSIITRALRCICSPVTSDDDLASKIDALQEQYVGLPTGVAILLSETEQHKRSYWNCITNYPAENPFCPFCEKSDFEYDDGDMSVYSGSGTCDNCEAEISICSIELLKN
jgi:GGDEF domain-containing protein